MKILVITGSYPPELCGVGDYTEKLVSALRSAGLQVEVMANIDWSLSNYFKICKAINQIAADVIHIQFPSIRFGYGILPQLLSLKYKTIVTVHEVSQFHPIRKLWLLPFSLRAELIFTNQFEADYFKSVFLWYKGKPNIISIGSNIATGDPCDQDERDMYVNEIISFGLIRTKKGLEEVIKLGELIKKDQFDFKIKIIGQVIERNFDYFNQLKDMATDLPITWQINLSEKDVANQLSKHSIAYLPFPDGASDRRGSLLAALKNNLMVFTTKGAQTPAELERLVTFVTAPADFAAILRQLRTDQIAAQMVSKRPEVQLFMKNFDWFEIAAKHVNVYKQFLQKP